MAYRKRRLNTNRRMGKRASRASWRSSSWAPIISIGGIVLSVAALACLIIFVIVPMLSGKMNKPAPTLSTVSTAQIKDPNAVEDFSSLEKEALLQQKSINMPYIYGSEMVYSTGEQSNLNPPLKNIWIFNIDTEESKNLDQITCKYNNLFEPKMNENWIVFLDVNSTDGGGRICGYNRKTNKMFVIREYFFGMPKLSLSGDYVAWMQQTALTTDKLYVCNLSLNESVIIGSKFTDTPASMSAVSLCEKELIWTEKADPNADNTGSLNCVIKRMPIENGKTGEIYQFDPQIFVFDPMTNGNAIVFLDGARGPDSKLMVSIDGALPKEIDKNVMNYGIGNGFVAYTKDDTVYIYYLSDGTKGKLTVKNTRGELATVNQDMICWYDVTDGSTVRDIIKYAKIPADPKQIAPNPAASQISPSPSGSASSSSPATSQASSSPSGS